MSPTGPIIYIDDDEDDQFLLTSAIRLLNLPNNVYFFTDGPQALAYFETTQDTPFLSLCDINMPRLNGLELRRRINENKYLRQRAIPFISLTTDADVETVRQAYRESVQGFYRKAASYTAYCQQIRLIIEYWQSCLHPNNVVRSVSSTKSRGSHQVSGHLSR